MNRRTWQKLAMLGFAVLLGVSGAANAQEETGNVYVTVGDAEGSPLPGVSVTLAGLGAPQVQVSDAQGRARFLALDPGAWSLTAELEGFSTVEYPNIDVRVARNTTLEVTLTQAVEEVITVTSESPLLDERKLTQGTTISQIELEKIPTARDPWSVLTQTPGVQTDRVNVGGNESGQQAVFVAPGVSSDENSFLVDGVEITDMAAVGASPTYYDFDQLAEMQVSTGGTDVTKSAAGASVNLVTKRGTNEFRGSARFLRVDDNFFAGFLEQETPFRQQPGNELAVDNDGAGLHLTQASFVGNTINQVTEYGFEAGGPLVQDRLWAWGSFGTNDIRNRTGGTTLAQVLPDDTILENTAIKLNAQLSAQNSLLASFNNGDKRKFGRNASPTRTAPTTWDQRGPSALYKVEDTHVFNANFFLSGTWSHFDGGFSLFSKACIANQGCENALETFQDTNAVWQNSFLSGKSERPDDEIKLDGSYFFNTGSTSHEIKFGARLREFQTESNFVWPGRNVFAFQLVEGAGPLLAVGFRGKAPLTTQEYTSVWAQDTISLGNLTINAGLRYDLQEPTMESDAIFANPHPQLQNQLPAVSFGGGDPGWEWEDITPRVGITYALGEDRETLLRASYSQFPEQLEFVDAYFTNPLGYTYVYHIVDDQNGDGIWDDAEPVIYYNYYQPNGPTGPAAITPNRVASNFDAPITNEAIIGVEHAFLPEFVVGLDYRYRLTEDLTDNNRPLIIDPVTGVERPAVASDWVQTGTLTGVLPDGTPYAEPVFDLACGGDIGACRTGGFLLENTSREVEYNGAAVNFIKRLSNRWMARGYFQYGEAEWSLGSEYVANSDPTDNANYNANPGSDNEGGLSAEISGGSGAKGNVILQSTWSYNLNGMYQVAPDRPWGFNVAANFYGREGTPLPSYHRVGRTDGLVQVQLTEDVDVIRADDIFTADVRLEKEFAATQNVGFTFSLDAFNLLDEDYVLQRERRMNLSSANFLRETLSPRIYRLGVRLNWR